MPCSCWSADRSSRPGKRRPFDPRRLNPRRLNPSHLNARRQRPSTRSAGINNEAGQESFWKFVQENWEAVQKRTGRFLIAGRVTESLAALPGEKGLASFKAHFEKYPEGKGTAYEKALEGLLVQLAEKNKAIRDAVGGRP